MKSKLFSTIEIEKNNKEFRFMFEAGSTFQEMYDSLQEGCKEIIKASEEYAKKRKEQEDKKTEEDKKKETPKNDKKD